jgi:hypothetical protein
VAVKRAGYLSTRVLARGATVAPEAFPNLTIDVADLLGC